MEKALSGYDAQKEAKDAKAAKEPTRVGKSKKSRLAPDPHPSPEVNGGACFTERIEKQVPFINLCSDSCSTRQPSATKRLNYTFLCVILTFAQHLRICVLCVMYVRGTRNFEIYHVSFVPKAFFSQMTLLASVKEHAVCGGDFGWISTLSVFLFIYLFIFYLQRESFVSL